MPTAGSDLAGIAAGPDGSLWFTEENGYKVGRITTAGKITEYPIPDNSPGVSDGGPTRIVASGGAMWFLDDINSSVYRIATDGSYKELLSQDVYPVSALAPSKAGGVWMLMSHGDGIDSDGDAVVLMDPSGHATGYPATHANTLDAIALGPDGSAWYNDEGTSLNKLTQAGQDSTAPLSATSADEVSSIAFARDGTPWFTEYVPNTYVPGATIGTGGDGEVGDFSGGAAHITPIGDQSEDAGIEPYSLVPGPDGDLWFAFATTGVNGYNGIGRIDPASGQVEGTSTGNYLANGITFGTDGALWFFDRTHNLIGRVRVAGLTFHPLSGS